MNNCLCLGGKYNKAMELLNSKLAGVLDICPHRSS